MNVITRKAIQEITRTHPTATPWLARWLIITRTARWMNLQNVREVFRLADQVGTCLIFDVGNGYRLIVGVVWANESRRGALYIKHFITHNEYNKNNWKKDCQSEPK